VENTPNVGGNVVADVVMTDRALRLYFGFGFGFEYVYNRAIHPSPEEGVEELS